MPNPLLKNLPTLQELLDNPTVRRLTERVSRHEVVGQVRGFLDDIKRELQSAVHDAQIPNARELAERFAHWVGSEQQPSVRPVINATGILIHRDLGGPAWAESARNQASWVAGHYINLRVDLSTGGPQEPTAYAQRLLQELTGAEAACIVHSHAAAVLLALVAIAPNREVVVSRAHLGDLEGTGRLPDLIAWSGGRLREVGAVNQTQAADYSAVIGPDTAAILNVQASNFQITGANRAPQLSELTSQAEPHKLPVIDVLGNGTLVDVEPYGVQGEALVQERIRQGAHIVIFRGDGLIGGPPCGLVVGRRVWIERIAQHPLAATLALDKSLLAATTETLALYRQPTQICDQVPTLRLLSTSILNLQQRAERLAAQMATMPNIASAEARAATTYLTSDRLPLHELPTWGIALRPRQGSLDELAGTLRQGNPALIGRTQEGAYFLDLRAVHPKEDMLLVDAVQGRVASAPQSPTSAQ